ncbi:hypothetical protein GCK32_002478 [Trichostrongylus colubriformis]|uniref:Uncharacterized protein n=1 Tax=Trichostrongylus colubriformis TaxID=6319 RepID=A0AAN8IGI5_TRICO
MVCDDISSRATSSTTAIDEQARNSRRVTPTTIVDRNFSSCDGHSSMSPGIQMRPLQIEQGLGPQLNRYLALLRHWAKQSLSTYELSVAVEKLLSKDLRAVHDEFVAVLAEACQLSTLSRSVEDVLSGKKGRELKKGYVPHISSINALLVLRSLENGWAAPDSTSGQIIGEAVKTMLADRIDAAVHMRRNPTLNGIGFRSDFEPLSNNSIEQKRSIHQITASDLLESFANKSHFLGAETPNLLRMKCHSNFYEKLKSCVTKAETFGGQAMSANNSVTVVPEGEYVEEVTVHESFCNVTCVAAYANISISADSSISVFSGQILPSTTRSHPTTLQRAQDISRNYTRSISHPFKPNSQKLDELGTPTSARVHWEFDMEPSAEEVGFSRDRSMKRKRVDAWGSNSDAVSVTKMAVRKFAKLELNASSSCVNLSSSESASDDIEVTSMVKRRSLSPSLVGKMQHHLSLQSALSAKDESSKARNPRTGRVVTIEISSDEDMEDEEEPVAVPESQLASESRKLIKSMESSMSKPRRTAHPIKPGGSSLDKGAIQKAQAIIEAWRSSSYEVVPDEANLSVIERSMAPPRSRRSLHSSKDSLLPTDNAENSQAKAPRSRAQRRTRTLPPKEAGKKEHLPQATVRSSSPRQRGDVFVSPGNNGNLVTKIEKTTPLRSDTVTEEVGSSKRNEPSDQLTSSQANVGPQAHQSRGKRSKKVVDSVRTQPDTSSPRDILQSEARATSKSRTPSPDKESVETRRSQRGVLSKNRSSSSKTPVVPQIHRPLTARSKKPTESTGGEGPDSVHTMRSDKNSQSSTLDPVRASESPASSLDRSVQKSREARSSQRAVLPSSSLSSSETQEDSQTQFPRRRMPKKLAEAVEVKKKASIHPRKSGINVPNQEIDFDRTSESPTSSPERLHKKSSKATSQHGPISPYGISSSETQGDSQERNLREKEFSSKDTSGRASKHREAESSRPGDSVEGRSRRKEANKGPAQLQEVKNSVPSDYAGSSREKKRISFEDQIFPEKSKNDGSSSSKAKIKRAAAGRDEESKCEMAQIVRAEDLLLRNKGVIDPFNRLGCNIDPVVVVVEFCQIQGPRPLAAVCLKTTPHMCGSSELRTSDIQPVVTFLERSTQIGVTFDQM